MFNHLPPFAVQRIDHLVLRVIDLDKSIACYCDVLGCHVVKRRDDLALIHLRAGTSMIDLIAVDGSLGKHGGAAPGPEARNVDNLCLPIAPFNEQILLKYLRLHNIAATGPASDNFGAEGDGLSLYFCDPDGNLIELKGPSNSPAPTAF
jgi:glyoxylase I family protein